MKLRKKEHESKKFLMFELVSVRIVSLIFATLLFVGFVAVHPVLLGKEISYYNISYTTPLAITLPMVLWN